jgi:CRISPR-associated protein Csd1
MILQALHRLARREGLMEDPDFEPKPVAWLVRVSDNGKLLGIQGTHYIPAEEQKKKKPKRMPKFFLLPREKHVTSGDRAFLLFNKAEYVFGIDPEQKRPAEDLSRRFGLFREKVRTCFEETRDEGVHAVYTFLEDLAAGRQSITLPSDCATNDLFTFVFAPDIDRLVTDRVKVREYWKEIRKAKEAEGSTQHLCLVSGATFRDEVENFPPIKKVPGGTTSGVAIVSFNPPATSSAFSSYGWKGNDNAPISREAAEACATALNRLLNPDYPDPRQPGQTLPQRSLRLSSDTAVCYWSSRPRGDDFCSAFGDLLEAKAEVVKGLYQSIWYGKLPEIDDPSAFYALTLSGTQGRAIVRDWFESTVANVARNLAMHFKDLAIVRNTPKPKNDEFPPQFPMSLLLKSLAPQGDSEKIPPPLIGQLVDAVLHGTSYPFSILQRAVERARAEIAMKNDKGVEGYRTKERSDARAALIKAVLNRRKRSFPQTVLYKEIQLDMDPTNLSEGYTLGRLMAILERIQQEAIDNVNATVVDRYFSGASASPKTVFVRLLKNARHHVTKAKDNETKAGFIFRLDKLIDELASRFDPKHNGFPAFLDIEQQGLFVLGYHQMRKWLWMSKEERAEWEKNHLEAPKEYLWSREK